MDTVDVTLISAALAGIVSFASPCVLPLAIPYLAWIGAISVGAPHGARPRPPSRRTALVLTGAFVAGFVSMFVALGMAAALAAAWLEQWQRPAAILAGAVLIVLGLHVGRIVRVPIFDADARLHTSTHPAGPVGAYLVGVAFAFGWSPCIGPILAAVLTLAGTQKSVTRGALLLGVYGLGMGAPFLFGAALTPSFTRLAARARPYMRVVESAAGVLIVTTGVLIMAGRFWRIGLWLIETFPAFSRFG